MIGDVGWICPRCKTSNSPYLKKCGNKNCEASYSKNLEHLKQSDEHSYRDKSGKLLLNE